MRLKANRPIVVRQLTRSPAAAAIGLLSASVPVNIGESADRVNAAAMATSAITPV